MDKVTKYQNILKAYLEEYAATVKPVNLQGVESKVITDIKNNNFQLVRIGWNGKQHIFNVVLHFDIINSKIWFQCNNTDRDVVDELMEQGVEKTDIVLGFQPPYARGFLGFATA
jgi:hypothetical protein